MTTNGARTTKEVVELVQRYANEEVSAKPFQLRVNEGGTRQEDDWWYVVVRPDRTGVRSYEYSDSLTRIEDRIRDIEHVNVLLIPVIS